MSEQGPEGILFNLVKAQAGDSTTLSEIESQVHAAAAVAGIDDEIVNVVLSRFRKEISPQASNAAPRLLIDWGHLPRVGQSIRPEFSLLCPVHAARPEVHVAVDRDLDHDADDPLRRPQVNEPGLWTFHVPFRMTTKGVDCRPGHYLIVVQVFFREALPELPRFYRCHIRLHVPDVKGGEQGVLEIDGDGQWVVNLQGYNLKQFSKVVLKGGKDSIINLQNAVGGSEPASVMPVEPVREVTTFEYQLKIDSERQSRVPTILTSTPRAYLDAAGLFFDDGRRYLLLARPKATFGRSRDNDVVLRFLPASAENDAHSRNISRSHFCVELVKGGIEIRDTSRTGIEVDQFVVRERMLLSPASAGDNLLIDLGVTGTVPKSFGMEMTIFSPDRYIAREELQFWDELYCEMAGARLPRLRRQALEESIDSIRFERTDDLAREEAYVLLLREALIGGSPHRSAIVLQDSGTHATARLFHMDRSFWLEPLPGVHGVAVNEAPISPRMITRLAPGFRIQFGKEAARFDRLSQLHID